MKIQRSVIGRFLQVACKIWNSNYEDDSQIVALTFTKRCCSIEMAKEGLLLTYLCNRVDAETNEQVIAVPIGLLKDYSNGACTIELCEVVENGDSHVASIWIDRIAQCESRYAVQDLPEYHLLRDLAWHTKHTAKCFTG